MTANQIAYQVHLENVRTHQVGEQETNRSNRAREAETLRSNLARETETNRANLANEAENVRYHNLTTEETKRHNLFGEQIAANTLEETKRANQVREAESKRSNLANEAIGRTQASASYLGSQAAALNAATNRSELEAKKPLYSAQVGSETQKSINFGSSTKVNLAKANESRARTQLMDAQRKTENQTRLPKVISGYTGILGDVVRTATSGLKLFGG